MHIDARTLPNGTTIEGDICIIGAGAAGISLALEWANTPYKVILLESGGFQIESQIQDLYRGKSIGQRYFPLQSARLHYFGGTTGHWAGFCSTYDEIDFKKRDWVPNSGWPISRTDLDPFYQRAHSVLELGPFEYDMDYWKKKDPSLKSLPFDKEVLYDKVWQFSTPTRFGTRYRDAIEKAPNIHLYTYANVNQLETNPGATHISGVTINNLAGKSHTVKASQFVLAASAIQNARLLLASNRVAKNGIGNDYDKVGRYFMEHLEVDSADLALVSEAVLKQYMWGGYHVKMRTEIAVTEEKQRELKILNGTSSLSPYRGVDPPAFIDIFTDNAEDWLERVDEMDKASNEGSGLESFRRFNLFTRMEQAPNPDSRITLDTEVDALGMPRVILNWQLTELEKRSVRKLYELIAQQAGVTGAGRVELMEWLRDQDDRAWPSIVGGGWHHMGTTRMHDDPKEGVVDANCQVHGVPNLHIAGASCFSTAGAANPTLTLVALTLRLSDQLKKRIKA